jgi:hypothetical protein
MQLGEKALVARLGALSVPRVSLKAPPVGRRLRLPDISDCEALLPMPKRIRAESQDNGCQAWHARKAPISMLMIEEVHPPLDFDELDAAGGQDRR